MNPFYIFGGLYTNERGYIALRAGFTSQAIDSGSYYLHWGTDMDTFTVNGITYTQQTAASAQPIGFSRLITLVDYETHVWPYRKLPGEMTIYDKVQCGELTLNDVDEVQGIPYGNFRSPYPYGSSQTSVNVQWGLDGTGFWLIDDEPVRVPFVHLVDTDYSGTTLSKTTIPTFLCILGTANMRVPSYSQGSSTKSKEPRGGHSFTIPVVHYYTKDGVKHPIGCCGVAANESPYIYPPYVEDGKWPAYDTGDLQYKMIDYYVQRRGQNFVYYGTQCVVSEKTSSTGTVLSFGDAIYPQVTSNTVSIDSYYSHSLNYFKPLTVYPDSDKDMVYWRKESPWGIGAPANQNVEVSMSGGTETWYAFFGANGPFYWQDSDSLDNSLVYRGKPFSSIITADNWNRLIDTVATTELQEWSKSKSVTFHEFTPVPQGGTFTAAQFNEVRNAIDALPIPDRWYTKPYIVPQVDTNGICYANYFNGSRALKQVLNTRWSKSLYQVPNSISINTYPVKSHYISGQTFDPTGLSLLWYYRDFRSYEPLVGDEEITIYINGKDATHGYVFTDDDARYVHASVTVYSYSLGVEKTADFPSGFFHVSLRNQSLTIVPPTKVTYRQGDTFNTTGIHVYLNTTGGESEELRSDEYTLSVKNGDKLTSAGNIKITVTANQGPTGSFYLTVSGVTGISISQYPRTSFYQFENFSSTGLKVLANLTTGAELITDYTLNITEGEQLISSRSPQLVTIKYMKYTTNYYFDVMPVVNLKIVGYPKTEYLEDGTVSYNGLVVHAVYNDGHEMTLPKSEFQYSVPEGSVLSPGSHIITVTYKGFSTRFKVTVYPVVAIKVTKYPDRISYRQGQTFRTEGMEVTQYYANGQSRLTTDYTTDPANGEELTTAGPLTVVVSRGTLTDSFTIDVAYATGIRVSTTPKTEFVVGQGFSYDDLQVVLVYNDGTTKDISDWEISIEKGRPLTLTDTEVVVSYDNFTTSYQITVNSVTNIEVTTLPSSVYTVNFELDLRGMVVTGSDRSGNTVVVQGWTTDIPQGTLLTQPGDMKITVYYSDLSTSFYVKVLDGWDTQISFYWNEFMEYYKKARPGTYWTAAKLTYQQSEPYGVSYRYQKSDGSWVEGTSNRTGNITVQMSFGYEATVERPYRVQFRKNSGTFAVGGASEGFIVFTPNYYIEGAMEYPEFEYFVIGESVDEITTNFLWNSTPFESISGTKPPIRKRRTDNIVCNNNIRRIGNSAFFYTSMRINGGYLPSALEEVDSWAFQEYRSVKPAPDGKTWRELEVEGLKELPPNLSIIHSQAFLHCCFSNSVLTIPRSVTYLGNSCLNMRIYRPEDGKKTLDRIVYPGTIQEFKNIEKESSMWWRYEDSLTHRVEDLGGVDYITCTNGVYYYKGDQS